MRERSLEEWSGGLGIDEGAGLLLPGWQGGLVPAESSLNQAAIWPAAFDAVIEPMLAQAEGELLGRAPGGLLCCGGGPIPYREMLGNLRLRLRGIATLPLALGCASGTTVDAVWRECVARHPELEPLLLLMKRQWVAGALLFLRRLHHDAGALAAWLALPSLPPIAEVSGTGSDGHDGGQAVFAIRFASGQQIFYKPRPVTGEFLWWALLAEMAAGDGAYSLPAARVLPGGLWGDDASTGSRTSDLSGPDLADANDPPANLGNTYGWMEAVSVCAGARSDLYWERAGGLLCMAQQVGLTDLHMENVVRGEAGPAVADAECLRSNLVAGGGATDTADTVGEEAVGRAIEELLETGLLPFAAPPASGSLCSGEAGSDGIADMIAGMDVSGLFGGPAAVPSLLLPYWRCSPDRLPQLALARAYLGAKEADGARVSPLAVLPQMLCGYRGAARALISIRGRLLACGGWLDMLNRFHSPRVVVRPTLEYALLVSRSLAPDCLESADARRSALVDSLKGRRALISGGEIPCAVREAETDALMALDLPRFIVPAGTRGLALSSGRMVVPQFLHSTAAETIRCRLQGLSEESVACVHVPAMTMACLRAAGELRPIESTASESTTE